jgi:hypothetical protein
MFGFPAGQDSGDGLILKPERMERAGSSGSSGRPGFVTSKAG